MHTAVPEYTYDLPEDMRQQWDTFVARFKEKTEEENHETEKKLKSTNLPVPKQTLKRAGKRTVVERADRAPASHIYEPAAHTQAAQRGTMLLHELVFTDISPGEFLEKHVSDPENQAEIRACINHPLHAACTFLAFQAAGKELRPLMQRAAQNLVRKWQAGRDQGLFGAPQVEQGLIQHTLWAMLEAVNRHHAGKWKQRRDHLPLDVIHSRFYELFLDTMHRYDSDHESQKSFVNFYIDALAFQEKSLPHHWLDPDGLLRKPTDRHEKRDLAYAMARARSFDAPLGGVDGAPQRTVHNTVASRAFPSPSTQAERQELKRLMDEALTEFGKCGKLRGKRTGSDSARYEALLRMHYGIGSKPHTNGEISQILNLENPKSPLFAARKAFHSFLETHPEYLALLLLLPTDRKNGRQL